MRINIPLSAAAIVGVVAAGCGPVGPVDTDEDGLTDGYELSIGTDPELADSDGDGHTDRDELYDFTDPADEDSFPYTGGWDRLPYPDDLGDDEGREVGKVMENFHLVDQFGEEVELHHFYGDVVLVESAAEW